MIAVMTAPVRAALGEFAGLYDALAAGERGAYEPRQEKSKRGLKITGSAASRTLHAKV
jgi:hypothetical protein